MSDVSVFLVPWQCNQEVSVNVIELIELQNYRKEIYLELLRQLSFLLLFFFSFLFHRKKFAGQKSKKKVAPEDKS